MVLIGSRASPLVFLVFSLFALLVGPTCAIAAPQVSATVDSNQVGLNDQLQLEITITSDSQMQLGEMRLPPLDGFELLNSNVSQQVQQRIINGQVEMVLSQVYIYLLQPTKVGVFVIPEVDIPINGQSFKTKPIRVTVSQQGRAQPQQQQPNRAGEEEEDPFFEDADSLFQQLLKRHGLPGQVPGQRHGPQPKINPEEAFFIQLEADKNEAYVGEQVTATWWIYTRNTIQNIDTLKYPNLRSFIKEDIEVATRLDWKQEVINGIPYRKALLVSYALFPIKEGIALIDSYKAKCTVMVGGGPFGFGQSYTFTKASSEVKVKVKPIPTSGRPSDFSGGVGQFQIQASVENPNVATNQPFALKIRFDGTGNAKSIDLPALNLPKSLEVYSQRDETKFNREGTSFKEFEVLLIPRESGKITIPKLTMSFFDTVTGSFYTKATEPIELNVSVGKGGGNSNVDPKLGSIPTKKPTAPEPVTSWESFKSSNPLEDFFIWILVFGVVIIFIVWRVFVEFQIGVKRKSIANRMNRRLKTIQALINKGDWRKVGAELTNVIYLVVGAITGEEGGSSVQLDKLFASLAPSLKKEFEVPIKSHLARCETLSFAPEGVVGAQKNAAELEKLKKEVESLMGRFIKAASAAEDETN